MSTSRDARHSLEAVEQVHITIQAAHGSMPGDASPQSRRRRMLNSSSTDLSALPSFGVGCAALRLGPTSNRELKRHSTWPSKNARRSKTSPSLDRPLASDNCATNHIASWYS
jgi:hypothetical protein